MRCLITGSEGFIATHLRAELMAAGHEVFGIDIRSGSEHQGDLCAPGVFQRVLDDVRPDVVIHAAAQVGRLFGEDDLAHTVRQNAEMTTRVARACGASGVRLAFTSTSEVMGDRGDTAPVTEDELYGGKLTGMYALSKRWAEEACRMYAPDGLVILRLSMPAGPGLPPGRGRAALPTFLWHAMHRRPLTVHRGAERSWCWVGDTVRGIRLAIEACEGPVVNRSGASTSIYYPPSGRSGKPRAGTYNVGRDDNPRSMLEVAQWACAITGAPFDLIEVVDPPPHQTVIKRLSTEKLRGLGWAPQTDLPEIMARTHEWLIAEGYGPKTLAQQLRPAA